MNWRLTNLVIINVIIIREAIGMQAATSKLYVNSQRLQISPKSSIRNLSSANASNQQQFSVSQLDTFLKTSLSSDMAQFRIQQAIKEFLTQESGQPTTMKMFANPNPWPPIPSEFAAITTSRSLEEEQIHKRALDHHRGMRILARKVIFLLTVSRLLGSEMFQQNGASDDNLDIAFLLMGLRQYFDPNGRPVQDDVQRALGQVLISMAPILPWRRPKSKSGQPPISRARPSQTRNGHLFTERRAAILAMMAVPSLMAQARQLFLEDLDNNT